MAAYRQGKKRRMKKFVIDEIAAVDSPAQTPATAAIIKRRETVQDGNAQLVFNASTSMLPGWDHFPGVKVGDTATDYWINPQPIVKSLDDSDLEKRATLLTNSKDGHSHILYAYSEDRGGETSYGSGDEDGTHDHPWVMNTDGSITIGENHGHTHEVDAASLLQIFAAMAMEKSTPVAKAGDPDKPTSKEAVMPEDKTTEDKLVAKNEELEARVARAESVASLSADHRAHFDGLEKDAQEVFLAKSSDSRDSDIAVELAKSADADAVIYTASNGDEFRKSDDARLVKMAKERDSDRKELAKAKTDAAERAFEKRADQELPKLKGDLKVRAAITKALDGIEDEDIRKSAWEAVKSGSEAISNSFETFGHEDGTVVIGDADAELDKLAKAKASKDGIDFLVAYEQVGKENPNLLAKALKLSN